MFGRIPFVILDILLSFVFFCIVRVSTYDPFHFRYKCRSSFISVKNSLVYGQDSNIPSSLFFKQVDKFDRKVQRMSIVIYLLILKYTLWNIFQKSIHKNFLRNPRSDESIFENIFSIFSYFQKDTCENARIYEACQKMKQLIGKVFPVEQEVAYMN